MLWGLRGGGGNFGVATRLDFRLYPLDGLVGGILEYHGDGVRDALRRFRDVVALAPPQLSCQAVLELGGPQAPVLVVAPSYTGSAGDPEEIAALRSAPGLVSDGLRSQPFLDQQRLFDSPYGKNRHYWKGHFVRALPDELIDELVRRVVELGRPSDHVLIESLHGAPKDTDPARRRRLPRRRVQRQRYGHLAGSRPATTSTSRGRGRRPRRSSRGHSVAAAT